MNDEIKKFEKTWGKAVTDSNLDGILSLYANGALLKPTLSDKIRRGVDQIRPYFEGSQEYGDSGFLHQGISHVKFLNEEVTELEDSFLIMGQYHFTKPDGVVEADFTFSLRKSDYKILLQHSSLTFK